MTTTVLRPNSGTSFANLNDDSDSTLVAVGTTEEYELTSYTLPAGAITKSLTVRCRYGAGEPVLTASSGGTTVFPLSTPIVTNTGVTDAVNYTQTEIAALTVSVTDRSFAP